MPEYSRKARPVEGSGEALAELSAPVRLDFEASVFHPDDWESIADDVVEIEEECFSGKLGPGQRKHVESWRRDTFTDPGNLVILLRQQDGRLVGFTYAELNEEGPAHVKVTAVHPEFQGQKLVGKLMDLLESELRAEGFESAMIDAVKENGYADKIVRSYGRRITDYHEDSTHAHITYTL